MTHALLAGTTTIAAAVATLLAATVAAFALVFARRAARAAGQQVAAAQERTCQAAELEWQRSRAYVVAYIESNPWSRMWPTW